jgi:hypothetical protein
MKQTRSSKRLRLFVALAAGVLSLSMVSSPYAYLLDEEDREFERADREDGPELSAPLSESPRWESFNEWWCFSTQSLQLECTELDYGEMHVPTLRIANAGHLFDFSMERESELGCGKILEQWKDLLEGEDAFCVYAAYLQDLPADHFGEEGVERWTLRILSQIKTRKGYLSEEDMMTEVNPTGEESREDDVQPEDSELENTQEQGL